MLGSAAPYDYIHNFWSDQYEDTLQYVGHATNWDDLAVRSGLAEGKFVGFYLLTGGRPSPSTVSHGVEVSSGMATACSGAATRL